jgi:hypothetical protein
MQDITIYLGKIVYSGNIEIIGISEIQKLPVYFVSASQISQLLSFWLLSYDRRTRTSDL